MEIFWLVALILVWTNPQAALLWASLRFYQIFRKTTKSVLMPESSQNLSFPSFLIPGAWRKSPTPSPATASLACTEHRCLSPHRCCKAKCITCISQTGE